MSYTIGDTGLVPEYINQFFGIEGNEYTSETEQAVKDFQLSYGQKYEPIYNPATGLYDDPTSYPTEADPTGTYIYPTGIVNLFTLPSILDIEIPLDKVDLIAEVQEILGVSVSNAERGEYTAATKAAIEVFQLAQGIVVYYDDPPVAFASGIIDIRTYNALRRIYGIGG